MRSEQRKHRSNLSAGHEKSEPNDSGFSVALDAGGELVRRTTRFLPDDGTYLFEDVLQFKGTITARVITCSAWLLELYELVAGELFFISSGIHIRPATKVFGVLYPPFTISQPGFKNAKGS